MTLRPTVRVRAWSPKTLDGNDLLQWLGAAAVCWGTGLIYRPAGIVLAGVFLIVRGVLGDLAAPKEE